MPGMRHAVGRRRAFVKYEKFSFLSFCENLLEYFFLPTMQEPPLPCAQAEIFALLFFVPYRK